MANNVQIVTPAWVDQESANQVFELTIRDAFEKEGLGHLEEDIIEEIFCKKRMLQDTLEQKGEITFLIAKVNEQVIGTISFGSCGEIIRKYTENELENVGELGSVLVLPEFQNKGIGSSLINNLVEVLHKNGVERFFLDSGYKKAQKRWIKKFGEPYKVIKDYWGEKSDHMIWLCSVRD